MIYFLYGPDSFRSKQKLKDIIGSYKKIHKSGLNLIYIDAKEKSFSDFYNNFKITPMFAEKKLIILKNVFAESDFHEKFLKDIKDIEKLKDIVVVYENDSVDERKKFFKELKKYAKCQEFKPLQPAQLIKMISLEFEKKGVKINSDAITTLLNFVGNNLWQMTNEIAKLANYKKNGIVEKKDIELLVRPNIEKDIFKTIDALAGRNKKEALLLLHKHLDDGENSLYLLSMIAYQFRNLLTVKELIEKRKPLASCGLHPFVVRKISYLCNYFSFEQLKKIYYKIFQIDADIKTGKIDSETAIDLLIAQI